MGRELVNVREDDTMEETWEGDKERRLHRKVRRRGEVGGVGGRKTEKWIKE